MPYEPNPGQDVPETQRLAFQAIREVRHTVIRVITAHLRPDAAVTWHGLSFDFTGVVFDGGDFRGAEFSGGKVNFGGARFSGGTVDFSVTVFSGSMVDFSSARFSGGTVLFGHAEFTGGVVEFRTTEFSGAVVDFTEAEFSSGMVLFADARFCGGTALFTNAWFSGGTVDFGGAHLSGGRVYFGGALFSGGTVDFGTSRFSGGTVDFSRAEFHRGTVIFRYGHFSGGMVDFSTSRFLGGTVDFSSARFSGGTVLFSHAEFSGGTVDFSRAVDWSFPPAFPWTGTPPSGMKLPRKDGAVSLLPPAGPRAGTEVGSTTRINQVNPAYHDGHRPMGRTGMSGKQSYLYGTPTPITGVCTVCNSRAKLKKDGTMWSHRRKPSKPAVCQGSGIPPRPGSVKRKWPASTTRSPSLRAISGGAVESNRSHH
jgi:uncharacterized protein YjbI with pentapeptide repeats